MKHKAFASIVAAMAAVGMLAGCGSASGDANNTASANPKFSGHLTIWADATRYQPVKDSARQFSKDAGVKVDVIQRDYSKIQQDFTSQAPTGTGPDIVIGGNDWTGKLVQNGVISPVTLGTAAKDYASTAVQAVTYKGKVYGLPYAMENIGIYRNPRLAPKPAKSYDDMIATGKQLVAQGKAKYPFLVQQDPADGDPYHMFPFQSSFGALPFASQSDGSLDGSKVAMGGEQGAAFAKWLAAQSTAGIISPNYTADIVKDAFIKGQVPYVLSGPWNTEAFQQAIPDVAVDPIPQVGSEKARPLVSVQAFFISSYSKNALAANYFLLNYIGTKKVQLQLFKAGQRPPALLAAQQDPSVADDPIMKALAGIAKDGIAQPNIPQMSAVYTYWGPAEASIEFGKGGDPAQVWQDTCNKIDATIASAK